MGNNEFTAGPWQVGAPQNKIITAYRCAGGNMTKENLTANGFGKVVAKITWPKWKKESAWSADAYLIAAAPDMFEAIAAVCEEPIMWAEDKHFDGNGGYYALSKDKFDAMCAALSKAKGHNTLSEEDAA